MAKFLEAMHSFRKACHVIPTSSYNRFNFCTRMSSRFQCISSSLSLSHCYLQCYANIKILHGWPSFTWPSINKVVTHHKFSNLYNFRKLWDSEPCVWLCDQVHTLVSSSAPFAMADFLMRSSTGRSRPEINLSIKARSIRFGMMKGNPAISGFSSVLPRIIIEYYLGIAVINGLKLNALCRVVKKSAAATSLRN